MKCILCDTKINYENQMKKGESTLLRESYLNKLYFLKEKFSVMLIRKTVKG